MNRDDVYGGRQRERSGANGKITTHHMPDVLIYKVLPDRRKEAKAFEEDR